MCGQGRHFDREKEMARCNNKNPPEGEGLVPKRGNRIVVKMKEIHGKTIGG